MEIEVSVYYINIYYICGPSSSVGLDGPGSNPGEEGILCPSRPALGPTPPPVKWVASLSLG